MKIAVVGGAGKMGLWFARYFIQKGIAVSVFDIKPVSIAGIAGASSLRECLDNADLVLVSVPVQKTTELIEKCAKEMKKGSCLIEISSVKSKTFHALRKMRKDLSVLCLHPMFGPGADGTKSLKMLIIPVRDKKSEYKMARKLFPGMSINVVQDARTHDKSIAAVLGLTYFVNVTFADMMSKEDLRELKKIGGTTFGIQTILAESIMTDEPQLTAALLRDNPYISSYISKYLTGARCLAQTRKIELAVKKIRKNINEQANLQGSYNRLYAMIQDRNIT